MLSLTKSEIESKFTGGPVACRLQSVAGVDDQPETGFDPMRPAVTFGFVALATGSLDHLLDGSARQQASECFGDFAPFARTPYFHLLLCTFGLLLLQFFEK